MRILYIAFPNSVHTQRWVDHFKKENDVMLIGFYPSDPIEGIEFRNLPVRHKNLAIAKLPEVKKLIREFRPDILHAHYGSSCGLVAALSGFRPFVLSVWGDDIQVFPRISPIHRWVMRRIITSADRVTATSSMLARSAERLVQNKKRIEVVPFGVDLGHYKYRHRESKETVHIGTVRMLLPKYGLDYLIKAFSEIAKSGQNVKLTIVGKGPQGKELESLAKRLNISNQVRFTGFVPNYEVVSHLNEFDIFVMPSVEEGETFGVAAVEAMATGLPVIASNIGGLPEVVENNVNGLLIQPKSIKDLAHALETYIREPYLRISHGKEGRRKVETCYNWEDNAKSMENIYRELLQH